MRKNIMLKIIPSYEGEVWCISKHLLATSMRLMEVGTKQQSMGNVKEAYNLFNQAYDLYCLFWGLNMNIIDAKEITWKQDSVEEVKKEAEQLIAPKKELVQSTNETDAAPTTLMGKLKSVVRKAVDCCIE